MKSSVPYFLLLVFLSLSIACTQVNEIKLIPIKSGDKWGYINKEGDFIINPQFEAAHLFMNGLALVQNSEKKFGYISEEGKYVINPIYKDASSFSEDLACVILEDGKPQIINKEGNIMFTVEADQCGGFSDGLAPFKKNGKWGYIDKTGTIVINALYDKANRFSEGLAAVAKYDSSKHYYIWGFVDDEGGIAIDFQFLEDTVNYCYPSHFSEGLTFVTNDGVMWGCIDKTGKYVVNPQFDGSNNYSFEYKSIYEFKNGVAAVKQGENWGYINKKGKYVINPQFSAAMDFTHTHRAAVQNSDGKFGFVDMDGKYIVNPQFDRVGMGYSGDYAIVKSTDKYGLINKEGTYTVNPKFDDIWICSSCWYSPILSDYIDYKQVSQEILSDTSIFNFNLLDQNLGSVLVKYPSVSKEDLSMYSLQGVEVDKKYQDVVELESVSYYFDNPTYENKAVYKTVQRYSYWSGYYYDREFDHYDKVYQNNASIYAAYFSLSINQNGIGKSQKLCNELVNQLQKKYNVKKESLTDINNTKKQGIVILRNDKILIQLIYETVENDTWNTNSPYVYVTIVNNNYDDSFENLIDSFTKSYKKNYEKDTEATEE